VGIRPRRQVQVRLIAAAVAAAGAATHRGHRIVVIGITGFAAPRGENREQAAHLLALAFHAHHIVCVLVADDHFKLCIAVRAFVFVQRHEKITSTIGIEYRLFMDIVLLAARYVKSK
jgi:hypothetical protein